jgi:hypothetical protein
MPDKRPTIREELAEIRQILKTLAVTTAQHDDQIDALIRVAERHDRRIAALDRQITTLVKQWQAYVNTLPRT